MTSATVSLECDSDTHISVATLYALYQWGFVVPVTSEPTGYDDLARSSGALQGPIYFPAGSQVAFSVKLSNSPTYGYAQITIAGYLEDA